MARFEVGKSYNDQDLKNERGQIITWKCVGHTDKSLILFNHHFGRITRRIKIMHQNGEDIECVKVFPVCQNYLSAYVDPDTKADAFTKMIGQTFKRIKF